LGLSTAVGAVVGAVLGLVAGIPVLRWALAGSEGWADLAAVAAAMVTFLPVGALLGGAVGARRVLLPWWRRQPVVVRRSVAVFTAAAVGVPLLLMGVWGGENAVAAAVWGLVVGPLVGWAGGSIAHRAARRPAAKV
jgi:hypothetical protein